MKLYFEEYGMGLPVVFLHGYPLDHTIWNPLIPLLETKIQLVLPDLRGHGKSPAPSGLYAMQDLAEDVKDLVDLLGFSHVLLVGQSMGGYVALQFAHSYPQNVLGLILVASHPYPDDEEKREGRYASIRRVQEEGVAKALAEFPAKLSPFPAVQAYTKEIISTARADGVIGCLQAMADRADRSEVLSMAQYPTAIILGEKDLFISPDLREKMLAQFLETGLTTLDNAAHMLMIEEPQAVSQIIEMVVSKIEE